MVQRFGRIILERSLSSVGPIDSEEGLKYTVGQSSGWKRLFPATYVIRCVRCKDGRNKSWRQSVVFQIKCCCCRAESSSHSSVSSIPVRLLRAFNPPFCFCSAQDFPRERQRLGNGFRAGTIPAGHTLRVVIKRPPQRGRQTGLEEEEEEERS